MPTTSNPATSSYKGLRPTESSSEDTGAPAKGEANEQTRIQQASGSKRGAPLSYDSIGTAESSVSIYDNDDDGDDKTLRITIDDAIERLGMGRFQFLILLSAGLCFAADSMEVLLLSFLAVVLRSIWGLTDAESASITSAVFLGASTGTLVLGYLGDKIGRKPVFSLTAALICAFGFLTAGCENLTELILCRFMVGFGVGGLTVPFDTLAEFVPNSHRGRDLLMIEYFWTAGTLLVPVVAMMTLGRSDKDDDAAHDNEWRWFVVLLGVPCLISSVVSLLFVPESPRWLLTQGEHDKALEILRAAAKTNGKNGQELFPPGTVLLEEEEEESQDVMDLFKPQWRMTTILLWCVWGGFALSYYGTILGVTMIFASGQDEVEESEGQYSFDYSAILTAASSEVVGTTAAILAVDRAGRIPTQVVSYLGGGVCFLALTLLAMDDTSSRTKLILAGFLARMFLMGGSCTTWVTTAEVLTTEIRTTGHSWANAVARLAGAFSPFLVSAQHPYSTSGIAVLVVCLATALCSSRLPETKGRSMGHHARREASNGFEVVTTHG